MQLDHIQVALRPRNAWEGLDLGFVLARNWFWPLWRLWLLSAVPVGLIFLPLSGLRADLWLLALWWFKPVYELPLLAWMSQALFGRAPDRGDLPTLLRAGWNPRVFPALSWRRLSPRRSFLMPVSLLEGLGGRSGRQRRRLLNEGGAAPTWLTLVCYHFEVVLWASLLLGLFLLVPSELPRFDLESAVTEATSWPYWISVLGYVLVFSLVAPFYVCAGFALYLNRRTELEAWDLELAFRKASESRARWPVLARMLAFGWIPLALVCALPAVPLEAADLSDPEAASRGIQAILESPDFGEEREEWSWMPIEKPEPESDPPWIAPDRLEAMAVFVGRLLKWILMASALVALTLLAARILRDWTPVWLRRRSRPPSVVDPLTVAIPIDLPLDRVAERVRAALADGDEREALALLYRASLSHLIRLGLNIPEGATESECLALAFGAFSESDLGPVPRLVRAWQSLAYAHAGPSSAVIDQILADWCRWIQFVPSREAAVVGVAP